MWNFSGIYVLRRPYNLIRFIFLIVFSGNHGWFTFERRRFLLAPAAQVAMALLDMYRNKTFHRALH